MKVEIAPMVCFNRLVKTHEEGDQAAVPASDKE
jgi:hypothetical protein